jgi:hypothetical protein
MYWDAYRLERPNERPYALHRNGAAGMARYASFLWSGDVSSMWLTLKNQVPIGINSGLRGIPYWGTGIGGFVPTAPRRRLQDVAAGETGPACEARRIQQVRGIRRQTSGDAILTATADICRR